MNPVLKKIFLFSSSVKLTIVLFALLGVTLLFQVISEIPSLYKTFSWFRFYKYIPATNTWFAAIAGLFFLNLGACSVKRFITSKKESLSYTFPLIETFEINNVSDPAPGILAILKTKFKKNRMINHQGKHIIASEKGGLYNLGFYLAHLSMLCIAVGAVLSLKSFEYSFEIKNGEIINPLHIRDASGMMKKMGFSLGCDSFTVLYYPGTTEPKSGEFKL